MGEYAKFNGQQIKIGTCENMYYLRIEDSAMVSALPGNVNPAIDTGLRFRIPFPDEDNIGPGGYSEYNRGARIVDYNPDWLAETDAGMIQLRHDSGLLLNVPCHHGVKLPEVGPDMRAFWNGKKHALELAFIKRETDGKLYPVVRCRHCGDMWRDDWENVIPRISDPELQARLRIYAAA